MAAGTVASNDAMTLALVDADAVIAANGRTTFHQARRVHREEAIEGEEDRVVEEVRAATTENRTVAPTIPGERWRTD